MTDDCDMTDTFCAVWFSCYNWPASRQVSLRPYQRCVHTNI